MKTQAHGNNWTTGTVNGFDFQIKHFDNKSVYGIDEGRISKLWISKNGQTYANYDRDWDIYPTDAEAIKVFKEIIEKYN